MTTPALSPPHGDTAYGRRVWEIEIGERGAVVEGHDHRAWAALSRWARADRGWAHWDDLERAVRDEPGYPRPRRRWMTWRDECGCTPEQHAAHFADDVGCDRCETGAPLPPCETRDEVAWMASWHDEPVPGAAPVIVWEYEG